MHRTGASYLLLVVFTAKKNSIMVELPKCPEELPKERISEVDSWRAKQLQQMVPKFEWVPKMKSPRYALSIKGHVTLL